MCNTNLVLFIYRDNVLPSMLLLLYVIVSMEKRYVCVCVYVPTYCPLEYTHVCDGVNVRLCVHMCGCVFVYIKGLHSTSCTFFVQCQ